MAQCINTVIEAGRGAPRSGEPDDDEANTDAESNEPIQRKPPRMLQPFVAQPGESPHNAVVTAEQSESALGHNQATELDNEVLEMVDQDQRKEEEALLGRHVNP